MPEYNVGLKIFLQEGLSESEFYGNLVYKFSKNVNKTDFSEQLKNKCLSLQIIKTITKTYLYNSDPLKPQFYIVKLEFTGVYIIFLISAPRRDGFNEYPQCMF